MSLDISLSPLPNLLWEAPPPPPPLRDEKEEEEKGIRRKKRLTERDGIF